MARSARLPRWLPLGVLLAALALLAACGSTGPKADPSAAQARPGHVDDGRVVRTSALSDADRVEFQRTWHMFVTKDPGWPRARDTWLSRGDAAPYLLAENLFRYFWTASKANHRAEVLRVANEAGHVGEPAVEYFMRPLVTDRWPLRQPVTVEMFNPDNINKPLQKTFTHFDIDDLTRQHATYVLAGIGAPAVPALSSQRVLQAPVPSAPRYAAYALGAIATDEAVAALGRMVRNRPGWQERGAAAKGLGLALRKNPAARPHLEAALQDQDEFVRRKAQEGLEGKTRIEF